MIKALIHTLYNFNESLSLFSKSNQQQPRVGSYPSLPTLSTSLISLESAVSQTCHIYNSYPSVDGANNFGFSRSGVLDVLLDRLQKTVNEIPSYTPGENSLSWVCSTAVSRSIQPHHRAFFSARLDDLLRRSRYTDNGPISFLGHGEIVGDEMGFIQGKADN
ncbi:hypothetical protein BJY04DRAFT_98865 [Aspergillus karnatakaensis]|uniref:uncharacterized protein n=1 Tax=Aspergillus karnatakaensis TaxID=1810916 RepID=UPI003CCD133F